MLALKAPITPAAGTFICFCFFFLLLMENTSSQADDSHEISRLIFYEKLKENTMLFATNAWHFKS